MRSPPTSRASAVHAATSPSLHARRTLATANDRPLGRLHLLALFVVALAIRLIAVALVQPQMGIDSAGYIAASRAIVDHGSGALPTIVFVHGPLYSFFLTIGLLVPGLEITWFAALSQAVLGAATVAVLARITARETRAAHAGMCAGALAAVHVSFVFWTAYVLTETLFLFLVAVCAERVLVLRASTSLPRDAALVGVLALLVVAARPTGSVLLVAVTVLVAMAVAAQHWRPAALVIACFSLPIVIVWAGLAVGPGVGSVPGGVVYFARSAVENGLLWTEAGRATSGVDVDVFPPPVIATLPATQQAEFVQEGPLAFAARHPEFVAAQAGRKLRTFWSPSLPDYSARHAVLSSVYFGLFYALAIVGWVQARRLRYLITLSSLSVVLLTLTSVVTIVDYDLRYRLPAELFLIPLAGIGLAAQARHASALTLHNNH